MQFTTTNNSCNPFEEREAPCLIGNHVAYAVNASSVEDFQSAIQFAKDHNLRLVIRNTGHDYLGKSTGAHALGIWTRHLKSIELVDHFDSDYYQGTALRFGSGVDGGEAQAFAHSHDLMVVTGNCPSVGIAGGFTQGGGHSLASSYLGLGADQVLEYEVLTSNGDLLKATPEENEDLFWALTGGGGGTYGVVASMTVRAYPKVRTSAAILSVPRPAGSSELIQAVLSTFLQDLPAAVDAGVTVIWILMPLAFMIMPAMAPAMTQADLDELFRPTIEKLSEHQLNHQYNSAEYPDYLSAYAMTPQTWNVSDAHMTGRLIPRSLVHDQLPDLVNAIMHIGAQTVTVGVSYNIERHAPAHPVSVSPRLRGALFNLVSGLPLNMTDPAGWVSANAALQDDITGSVRRLAPDSGTYLSESNLAEPDWQKQLYGGNYGKLLEVKDKYDPDDVFYAPTAVGSHRWVEKDDGRLCRVDESAWSHSEL